MLERAGLVARTRVGREHLIDLRPDALGGACSWIEEQTRFWEARLAALDELLTDEAER